MATKTRGRTKNLFFKLSIVLFALYLVLALVKLHGDIQSRRLQLEELRLSNEEQRIANKELERILAYGTQDEYIVRIAREKLGFAYPEEQVLIDVSGS